MVWSGWEVAKPFTHRANRRGAAYGTTSSNPNDALARPLSTLSFRARLNVSRDLGGSSSVPSSNSRSRVSLIAGTPRIQQRKTEFFTALVIGFRDGFSQVADTKDVALALGDGYGAARVEKVEGVRSFQNHFVSW